jgi:hypothetical protein
MTKKLKHFKACFEKIWANLTIIYDIIKLLELFKQTFGLLRTFFHLRGHGLFENCFFGQIWRYVFLKYGNPATFTRARAHYLILVIVPGKNARRLLLLFLRRFVMTFSVA